MRIAASTVVTAIAATGGLAMLALAPVSAPQDCQQLATVVQYLPQPEPAPLWPPASLPSFESAPPVVAAKEPPKEVAEPAPAEEAADPEPRRKHRRFRHWRRRHW